MKKLLAILGVITCMIGLCACGQEDSIDLPLSEEDLVADCESSLDMMNMIIAQGTDAIEQYADLPVIYNALLGFQSALGDIGTYNGTQGGTVSINGDEVIVDVNVAGSSHDAVVEFVIDSVSGAYQSITTNVEYSFGETISKALLNTAVGMGTVFVVLIFISLIISCFGLISKVGTKKQKKEAAVTSERAVEADPVVAQIAEKEELAGDMELVAVIAAAIAAYEGSGSTDGFVVRSIRKSNKSKWQNA